MGKRITAALIAVNLVTPAMVYAQQPPAPASAALRPAAQAISPADAAAYFDARIAAIKAGLELTAAQEKAWAPVEAAMRDIQKQRAESLTQRSAAAANPVAAADPIVLLRGRADDLLATAVDLKRLADAAEPLYKVLDDSQKHRLLVLLVGLGNRR
jgi:LTXXQ motif family protein